MESREKIINELKLIAPTLSTVGPHKIYSVPEGYFEGLAENILTKISAGSSRPYTTPYLVPENYFDNLAESILQKINYQQNQANEIKQELVEIAPNLANIPKINVYTVPSDYWETISIDVGKSLFIPIRLGSKMRRWITYAAAASVLFVIAIGSFLFINDHAKEAEKYITIDQKLVQLNEADIVNYLIDNQELSQQDLFPVSNEQNTEMDNLLKNASDDEIQNYLDYSDPAEKKVKGI